jgi:hypothetical protein
MWNSNIAHFLLPVVLSSLLLPQDIIVVHDDASSGGPATFLGSACPVIGSCISVHETGTSLFPVSVCFANTTPRSFLAVER